MVASRLLMGALLQSSAAQDIPPNASRSHEASIPRTAPTSNEEADTAALINVRLIYVESFGDHTIPRKFSR